MALVIAIVTTLGGSWVSKAMKKIAFSKNSDTKDKPQNPWEPEIKFVLKCYLVMASLGGELLAAALAVIVMRQTGVGAFLN